MKRFYIHYWLPLIGIIVTMGLGLSILVSEDVEAKTQLRQWDEVISTVNGVEITVSDFQDRIRAERWYLAYEIRQLHLQSELFGGEFSEGQNPFDHQINILLGQLMEIEGFGDQVLQDMELQIVLEQEAERRGIVIDKKAIFAQLDNYTMRMTGLSLTPTPTHQPTATRRPTLPPITTLTPTPLPSPTLDASATPSPLPYVTNTPIPFPELESTINAYQESYYAAADSFGVSMEALTEVFYFQALELAMRESRFEELIANGDIPTQSLAAISRHILIAVPTDAADSSDIFDESMCESAEWEPYQQAAEDVLVRLGAGESFEALAMELSDDPGTADRGGFLGEVSDVDRLYVPSFAAAIHEAEIGEYYGPVCTQFGFHIVQVLDKYWRDLSEAQMRQEMNNRYFEWTTELLLDATIERGEDWPQWIIGEPTLEAMLGDLYDFDGNQMIPSLGN